MKGAWFQLCSFLHNLSHTPCRVKGHIKKYLVQMNFFVAKRKQSSGISHSELLMGYIPLACQICRATMHGYNYFSIGVSVVLYSIFQCRN